MTRPHPLLLTPQWIQYDSEDEANDAHRLRSERLVRDHGLDPKHPLTRCWSCFDIKKPCHCGGGKSTFDCSAVCQAAQYQLQRRHVRPLGRLMASVGSNPVLMTWVPVTKHRWTSLNMISLDAVRKDLMRRFAKVEKDLGKKVVAVGRFDFDCAADGLAAAFRLHVHLVVANVPERLLKEHFAQKAGHVPRPLRIDKVADRGALQYALKNQLKGVPTTPQMSGLHAHKRQKPPAIMQGYLDKWLVGKRLSDLLIFRGMRVYGGKIRLTGVRDKKMLTVTDRASAWSNAF